MAEGKCFSTVANLLLRVSGVGLETGSAGRGRIACDSTPLPDVVAREVLPLLAVGVLLQLLW
jgi:hypothetical protein